MPASIPPVNIDSFGRDNTAGATWAHTLSYTPTNGRLLVLAASVNISAATTKSITSITQTGVTWIKIIRRVSFVNEIALEYWYAWQVSGASADLTINWSTSTGTRGACIIAEYEAIDTSSNPYQRSTGNSATGDTDIPEASSQENANSVGDLLVSFAGIYTAAVTLSLTSGTYTDEHDQQGVGTSGTHLYLFDKLAESTDPEGYSADLSASNTWVVHTAAFTQGAIPPLELEGSSAISFSSVSVLNYNGTVSGSAAITFSSESDLTIVDNRIPDAIGLLQAMLESIAESDAELGGFRMTRLEVVAEEGAETFYVENVDDWPTSGAFALDGVRYAYTSRTATSLSGVTYTKNQQVTAGALKRHERRAPVLDVNQAYSQVDLLRRGFLVNYAEGEDLSVIGRNLNVDRAPSLSNDDHFRNIIKAVAYNPAGTIYGMELALDAIVGPGNYAIYERLVTDPCTVFIRIIGSSVTGNSSVGKTYLAKREYAVATAANAAELSASYIHVGSVRLKDENLVTETTAAKPSAQSIVEYPGDPGTIQWAFEGGNEASNALILSGYLYLSNATMGGAAYTRPMRIQPESYARIEWVVARQNNGPADPLSQAIRLTDTQKYISVGVGLDSYLAGVDTLNVGFIDSVGNFMPGNTQITSDATQFKTLTLEKFGEDFARLSIDGKVIQEVDYADFNASTDNEVTFGNLISSVVSAFNTRTYEVRVFATTDTDYAAARGAGDVAAPRNLDVGVPGFFGGTEVGAQVRITGSAATNPDGGNNNGAFVISAVVDDENVTLDGKDMTGATVDTSNPTRFTAGDAIFTYPDDLGKEVVVSGSGLGNDGTYVITDLLEPGTFDSFSSVLQTPKPKTSVAVLGAASFTSESNLAFKVRPVFVVEAGVAFELSGLSTLSGTTLTLKQDLPLPFADLVLDVLVIDVLSAHLHEADAENVVLDDGPPTTYELYPAYLSDAVGFIEQYVEVLTAAGVIPEFEIV